MERGKGGVQIIGKENALRMKGKPKYEMKEEIEMKRRKNVGGSLDLRKSLAWNAAFFTEQGVLNENELSRLTTTGKDESESVTCNENENENERQRQIRPSRLRMPSPSLKYFAAQGKGKGKCPSHPKFKGNVGAADSQTSHLPRSLPFPHPKLHKHHLLGNSINENHNYISPGENKPLSQNSQLPPQDKPATIPLIQQSLASSSSQHSLMSNHKLNPPPFSDEWLEALEEVGEEILTKKTGAVQNSPPDKSLPEPGPWSPVKRKNVAEIGPFDCTKYTNQPAQNLNS